MTSEALDQWLIRTQNNVIAGPVPKHHVLELINNGRLGPQDEVCRAGAYWFYLHEEPEVFEQLGIHAPRLPSLGTEEEITQTQTRSHPTFPELLEPSGGFDPDQTAIVSGTRQASSEDIQARIFQKPDRGALKEPPPVRPASASATQAATVEFEHIRRSAPQVVGGSEPKIHARVAASKTLLLILFLAVIARMLWSSFYGE